MAEAKKIDPTPLVVPHDFLSGQFFKNYEVVTSRDRRGIIPRKKKERAA